MLNMLFNKVLRGAFAINLIVISTVAQSEDALTTPVITSNSDVSAAIPSKTMMGENNHAKAPTGIFGATMIEAGKTMFSYTPMYMHMEDNYIGATKVSPETIVTTVPSGVTMSNGMMTVPEMYRIVPTTMNVTAQMFHVMYGINDKINLMAMTSYLNKSMNMTTYSGSSGTTILGQSNSATSGLGDTTVNSLWRIYKNEASCAHLDLGLSLPTGSINATTSMLTPMNKIMTMRATYGMQLGSGTADFLPGLTYTNHVERWSWGTAYRGRFALDKNSNGYKYGNKHELNVWSGYELPHGVTLTGRVAGTMQNAIHGADPQISGLMQGTNPSFYGGKRIDLFGGIDISGAQYGFNSSRLSIEAGDTVYQNLNGPQLGSAWQIIAAIGVGL
jgi:hypothetical protein